MKEAKILLVEDEVFLGQIVKESFETRNFEVNHFDDGLKGLEGFTTFNPDICVLDVMLPNMDGFTLAKEIKKINPNMPIIFLTAKSLTEDVIEGFEAGADDYVRKPFSMEELIMRVKAVLNRKSGNSSTQKQSVEKYNVGKYKFYPIKQELHFNTDTKKMTSRESELLRMLCENKNHLVERDNILNELWGDDTFFNARSMDVFITKLRKYLKNDPEVEVINVRGRGYKLVY
ncbi:MAG: response regulator transcription factor [Ichthyobacteriaceae bacterium]|nr:response regulator transcription factor [Ichthyobacteriaceae bacterium]